MSSPKPLEIPKVPKVVYIDPLTYDHPFFTHHTMEARLSDSVAFIAEVHEGAEHADPTNWAYIPSVWFLFRSWRGEPRIRIAGGEAPTSEDAKTKAREAMRYWIRTREKPV